MRDAAKVVARNSNPVASDVSNPWRQLKLASVVKAHFPFQKSLCFLTHIGSCKGRRSEGKDDKDSGDQQDST